MLKPQTTDPAVVACTRALLSSTEAITYRFGPHRRRRMFPIMQQQEAALSFVSTAVPMREVQRPQFCETGNKSFPLKIPQVNSRTSHRVFFPICKYGEGARGTPAVDKRDGKNLLHIVFVHPQIHWNTGNIGRTCLGLGATLHLVGPLGFSLEEKQVRRAGLDYWEHVDVNLYDSWDEFANGRMREIGGTRYFFTKFGAECATSIQWPIDGKVVMIFGSEVDGFDGIRDWLDTEGSQERKVAFPIVDDRFRSFNLSTTASMALWDAYKATKLREIRKVSAPNDSAESSLNDLVTTP